MSTYENSRELQGQVLQENDRVIFALSGRHIEYRVRSCYLSYPGNNATIFNLLGLNKENFCSNFYPIDGGRSETSWPQPPKGIDTLKELTTCVIALYNEISKQNDPNVALYNSLP